jgi:hypothetical protein
MVSSGRTVDRGLWVLGRVLRGHQMSFGTEVTRAVGASRLHGICLVWCPATFPDDLRTPSQTSANLTPGRPVVVEVGDRRIERRGWVIRRAPKGREYVLH